MDSLMQETAGASRQPPWQQREEDEEALRPFSSASELDGARASLAYLQEKELRERINPRYLEGHPCVTAQLRARAVHWLLEVNVQLKFRVETLCLAVSLADRMVQNAPALYTPHILAVAVAGLHMASKFEESHLRCSVYEFISQRGVTVEQVHAMERAMLLFVGYSAHFVTAGSFWPAVQALAAFRSPKAALAAQYILQLSLADYDMLHFLPSTVAAAVAYICRSLEGSAPVWTEELARGTSYEEEAIIPCVSCIIRCLIAEARAVRQQPISKAYSTEEYQCVAQALKNHFSRTWTL